MHVPCTPPPAPPARTACPRHPLPAAAARCPLPAARCPLPAAGYSTSIIPRDNKYGNYTGPLYDVGVIKLATPVSSKASFIQLPAATTPLTPFEKLQVAGWGVTNDGKTSNILE